MLRPYYKFSQAGDEALVPKQNFSETKACPHPAFVDPYYEDIAPRKGIDIRAVLIWPDDTSVLVKLWYRKCLYEAQGVLIKGSIYAVTGWSYSCCGIHIVIPGMDKQWQEYIITQYMDRDGEKMVLIFPVYVPDTFVYARDLDGYLLVSGY